MSGVAIQKKIKVNMPMKLEEPMSRLHVNLKRHGSMDKVDVGGMVHFSGKGKVTGVHKDKYGHTMDMDVHHVEPMKGGSHGRKKEEE